MKNRINMQIIPYGDCTLLTHAENSDGLLRQVEAKTDLTACFQLYGLELDCNGLDGAMAEFWAQNELSQAIDDAINNNALLQSVKANIKSVKAKLSSFSGRKLMSEDSMRALLSEVEDTAFGAIDADAFADEVHAATTKQVGEQLAEFMRRRKVLENPSEIINIKRLHGRTTINVGTHIELDAEAKNEYERDLAAELGAIGIEKVVPIPFTLGLVTVEVEAKMEVRAPVTVSVAGTVKSVVDLKLNDMVMDLNFFDTSSDSVKIHSGDTDGSKVYIAGSVAVSAAIQTEIKTLAEFKICFAGVCAGIGAEAMIDAAAGADAAITSTHADTNACLEWTMDTAHTKYAKYTDANKQPYEDSKAVAQGGLVVAGGAWTYITHPYMKVYPVLGMAMGMCSLSLANIFEYKPKTSLKDDLLSAQKYEHPFGKYLVRTAVGFGVALNTADSDGTFPISIPPIAKPSGWNRAKASGRHLLAMPMGATALLCTEYNGGSASAFKGSVPASRVSCGGDDRYLDVDGDDKPLCWSRDCCNGHVVQMSWARFVCVPANVAREIASMRHALL